MSQPTSRQQEKQSSPEYRSVTLGTLADAPKLSIVWTQPSNERKGMSEWKNLTKSRQPSLDTSSASSSLHDWKINDPLLNSIPIGYRWERTIIDIDVTKGTQITPQVVADCVTNCLRYRSIVFRSTIQDTNVNSIRAEGHCGLAFRISMFIINASASHEDTLRPSTTLRLEHKRLAGCGFGFHRIFNMIRKEIFQLQQPVLMDGRESRPGNPYQQGRGIDLKVPSCLPLFSKEQQLERLKESYRIAFNMLLSHQLDTQLLGLESLESISTKDGIISDIFSNECLMKLLSICQGQQETVSSPLQVQYDCLMKRRALCVIANGISQWKEDTQGTLPELLTSESFVYTLVSCLHTAAASSPTSSLSHSEISTIDPHQIFQVARCLVEVSTFSDLSQSKYESLLRQSHVLDVLSQNRQHLALEQEYHKLLSILVSH